MRTLTAGLIDVFANAALRGNPLAVVEAADGLDDALMRRIAGELNQAETTFLLDSDRADRKLRSFTASGAEVSGAGHNALGAWLWMAEHGALGALATPTTFHQQLSDAVLPITLVRRDGRVQGRMQQAPLRLGPPLDASAIAGLAEALGLATGDVGTEPAPRAGDTGAAHLLVRVRDADAVNRARPRVDALLAVLGRAGAEGCYVYAFDEPAAERAYARFFNPTVGLWEDAATGTAAGPLTAYLGSEGLLPRGELVIEQGTSMGRQSFLHVRLGPDPEISGSGVVSLRGTLHLP